MGFRRLKGLKDEVSAKILQPPAISVIFREFTAQKTWRCIVGGPRLAHCFCLPSSQGEEEMAENAALRAGCEGLGFKTHKILGILGGLKLSSCLHPYHAPKDRLRTRFLKGHRP